ncbi:MAG TPA: hypothetical protein VE891_07140 [Allosphingosinicella sp.]|nr:hypothetical protein [Allosphingosinicella sp.]
MPMFPKIQSACPYKSDLAALMDGDMCRMCKRNVFDLTAMDDGERLAFLAGCEEEECVSYRIPARAIVAAAALAAASMSAPAMGQEAAAPEIEAVEADSVPYDESMVIVVGGIKDPKKAVLVEIDVDTDVPEMPVVYDDEEAPASLTSAAGPAGA